MTLKGIKMTKEGEKETKQFERLLDKIDPKGQEKSEYWQVSTDTSSNKLLFKEIKEEGVIGQEFLSEKIYYCYAKSITNKQNTIIIKTRPDYIQVNFCLKGKLRYNLKENNKTIYQINPLTANFIYYKCDEIAIENESVDGFEVLVFNIHLGFLEKNFPDFYLRIADFIEKIKHGQGESFSPNNISISTTLRAMIQDFTTKRYSGCFLSHYVELKTLEFVILLMNEFDNIHDFKKSPLSEMDLEKMNLAKEILIQRMSNPPSLKDLANMVGTNEFDLKKKFKEAFGMTAFALLQDYKMELARKKLMETDLKIVEIAEELGYNHATHFTSAFKKAFGILPKDIKK
ncbi:AraC family transcriptional regulator [Belliella sp. DSM 107340]|uniref:AraC family transcriptional regulator n=1 Tax=Belliella calami TaxID=2923436 RepID=A0ABS9UQ44_9BACT|nr:AraC family transcriptional regulator [Belliella calami]MCH7398584.1 AraC family transcriptional regulator [Belliella calami]